MLLGSQSPKSIPEKGQNGGKAKENFPDAQHLATRTNKVNLYSLPNGRLFFNNHIILQYFNIDTTT